MRVRKLFCGLSRNFFSYNCNCRVTSLSNSCYNCVRVIGNLFNCYYSIRINCLSFLVRARNHCYAEYNGESENYFLHFRFGLK